MVWEDEDQEEDQPLPKRSRKEVGQEDAGDESRQEERTSPNSAASQKRHPQEEAE